jgi:transglutaminase-like putative cysteine protease
MKIKIKHKNIYKYDKTIFLESHKIQLYPRVNQNLSVKSGSIKIFPTPICRAKNIDFEGNLVENVWFEGLTDELRVDSEFELESLEFNPFGFFTEPINFEFPQKALANSIKNSDLKRFADEIERKTDKNVVRFLTILSQEIYEKFRYEVREEGEALSADETFARKSGACRDFSVLFMEICKLKGLQSRFVSGYKVNDKPEKADEKNHLHAWAEVYVEGGGWRGFDPTMGLLVDNKYIPLTASFEPKNTCPIIGTTRGDARILRFESKIELEFD